MIRYSLEHSAVDFLGVGELLVLLQKNRERDRLSSVNSRVDDSDRSMSCPAKGRPGQPNAVLAGFVGLDIELEMNARVEGAVGFCGLNSQSTLPNSKLTVSDPASLLGRSARHR